MPKRYYGKEAIAQVEKKIGRPLTYKEKRVVEEEGYVDGTYKDTKGILTAGVGQTGKYMGKSFDETFKDHEETARRLIPDYDLLPEAIQGELVQAAYRGDLQQSPKFRKLFNAGKYKEAAKEFLDNADYRDSKESGTGVAGRMERVAAAIEQFDMMQAAEATPKKEKTLKEEVKDIKRIYDEASPVDAIGNALKGLFKNDPQPIKEYEVQKGDTLSAIAKAQGKTVAQIVEDNNISNPDLIKVGQKLIL